MKNKRIYQIVWLALMLTVVNAYAQEQERLSPKVSMSYYQYGDDSATVKVMAYVKKGREKSGAENVIINLYLNEVSKAGMMGSLATDSNGVCIFPLVNKFEEAKDTLLEYNFIARIRNDENYEDVTSELSVQKASLDFISYNEDSVNTIGLMLGQFTDSGMTGIADEEIKVYVKRMYSLLPIGGDYLYTDDDGQLIVEFPNEIPGDENGNVKVLIRLDGHSDFGTLENSVVLEWGMPLHHDESQIGRALWASGANAPLPLVIGIVGMILGIWTVIIYIVWQIRKMHFL